MPRPETYAMSTLLFGKSLLLGLAIAAPLGPMGALCINRTLERGFWAGVAGGAETAASQAARAVSGNRRTGITWLRGASR